MVEYLRFVPVIKNIVSWLQTHPLGLVTLGFGHCKPHERICQKRMLEREPARLEEEGLAPSHLLPIPVLSPQHCFFISVQDFLPTAATKSSPIETPAPFNQCPPQRSGSQGHNSRDPWLQTGESLQQEALVLQWGVAPAPCNATKTQHSHK